MEPTFARAHPVHAPGEREGPASGRGRGFLQGRAPPGPAAAGLWLGLPRGPAGWDAGAHTPAGGLPRISPTDSLLPAKKPLTKRSESDRSTFQDTDDPQIHRRRRHLKKALQSRCVRRASLERGPGVRVCGVRGVCGVCHVCMVCVCGDRGLYCEEPVHSSTVWQVLNLQPKLLAAGTKATRWGRDQTDTIINILYF